SVYYANGQAIDPNSTVSALSKSVYASASVHEVPVWTFNGTISYEGNYEIDVCGRTEYFSISLYPYLSNALQAFVGSVTIPQLNITIPDVLYTGTCQTISISYRSSYAAVSNASIDAYLINSTASISIFHIHIMNLSADLARNITENLNLSITPGMYQVYFAANSSDIIFADQYVNVAVEDRVNVTMHWAYYYTLPLHDLKFDLSMFDASCDPADGYLQMDFLSGNGTAIGENTSVHISPLSYDNLTDWANSSKNLTSVIISLRYDESMFNYIPNQTAKIRLQPVFNNYGVRFSVFGQQVYPVNISINGILYAIAHNNTVITIPNGTYIVSAAAIPGYRVASPGIFSIDGSNVTVNIYISKVLYGISFKSNLKSGFSIFIDGNMYSGDGVSLPNGTYCLTVDPPLGYDTIRENLTVNGTNLTVFLNFQRAVYKMRMIINGSALPQHILVNGSTYSVSGSINISLSSGVYNVTALNSTYLRTSFRSTVDLLSNTTLYINYYRPYSEVYINASGYEGTFEIMANSSYYYVHAGDTIRIPFGFYSIRMENVQGYSETYGKNISIDHSSTMLNITFSRLTFMIHIITDIPADIVFGNTGERGQNFSVQDPYGNYDLSISRPGYYPINESVMLNSNETLEFNLRSILYKITIETDVDSFTIYAGNRTFFASGNNLTIDLPYGNHSIILKKYGYSNTFETIDVSSNGTIVLRMHRLPPESIIRSFIVDNYQDMGVLSIFMIAIYLLIIRHLRFMGRRSMIMHRNDRKRD
ncbi:MAG: hypothetical protein OWQ34_05160, partial [Thermoplasma acidophilum]|nr:hypothetical protein [Thermoplasma acidophilum]